MARQPQVVTAVIRPCSSPLPKETKRHCLAQHAMARSKSKSSESAQQKQTETQPSSSVSLKGNFAKPTASTMLKSIPTTASSAGRTAKSSKARVPVGLPKRKEIKSSKSPSVAAQKPRKPQLSTAARGGKTSSSRESQCTDTAASSTAGSTKQHSSSVSVHNGNMRKSTSLSSRAPQTSSAGRKSSGISAASTQTRYPAGTSATSGSGRRHRSPSPSAASDRSSRADSPRLIRSASHEARLNQIKSHIDHLRRTSPRIASPEFTSTRTNLAGRSRSPSPAGQAAHTADTSPWRLTGNSSVLFSSPPRPGSWTQSPSRSRSRSRSPGGAGPGPDSRRTGTTTWVETRNRASALGAAGRTDARASPPPTWQTKRHLPRVSYPRPSLATAARARSSSGARSSSSQTRRSASRDGRVMLQSRDGRHRSPCLSPHRPARPPDTSRRPARTAASSRQPARTTTNPRQPTRTTTNPHHPTRTPASRAVSPSTIDYSPQSRYMADLLKRGAVRRPAGRENRRPGRSGGSGSDRTPGRTPGGRCGSTDREDYHRGPQREAVRRLSAASQHSAASEPAHSARKPARSILRTSSSVGSNSSLGRENSGQE